MLKQQLGAYLEIPSSHQTKFEITNVPTKSQSFGSFAITDSDPSHYMSYDSQYLEQIIIKSVESTTDPFLEATFLSYAKEHSTNPWELSVGPTQKFPLSQTTNIFTSLSEMIQPSEENLKPTDLLDLFLQEKIESLLYLPHFDKFFPSVNLSSQIIYSGSYNPIHDGHYKVADSGKLQLPGKVNPSGVDTIFHLSVNNADKNTIGKEEILKRFGPVHNAKRPFLLSKCSLFKDQTQFSKGGAF